jgi:Transposase DDE domain
MIFCNSLPDAKAFFAPLALPLSSTLTLIRFLVACFDGLRSAADAANAIRTDPRHRAQLVRFLARHRWSRNWNTLAQLTDLLLEQCHTEVGTWVFLLDQTYHTTFGKHAQNTFSRGNKKARRRQSQRRQKPAHRHACHGFVFGLLISPRSGTRLPCVRSYYTRDYCRQQAATATRRRPAPTFRTQTDLAAEMIRDLHVPAGCPVLVLGDTAYEAQQIRAACRQRGLDWITPANPERVLAGPSNRQRLRAHRTHLHPESATPIALSPGLTDWWRHQRGSRSKAWHGKYARRYWAQAETLNVHNIGTVNVVFSTTQPPQVGRPSAVQKILLTNRSDWDATRVVAAYAVRWQIEQFFKEMKSDLGMSRYRVREFREVEGWVQVCCIAFVYLEWYRLRRREESERKEWWWRLRTRGLVIQVRRESEWSDLEQIATAMDTEEGRAHLRARLRQAVPWEQRQPA